MRLVKDCKYRTKRGRCEKWNHYCSFLLDSPIVCIVDKPEAKKRRSRKK